MGCPGPPAGSIPLNFIRPSSFILPQLLHPPQGRIGDRRGSTTHGSALLAWISTEAVYTLLSLEAKGRQVRGPVLEEAGGRATSDLALPSHVSFPPDPQLPHLQNG